MWNSRGSEDGARYGSLSDQLGREPAWTQSSPQTPQSLLLVAVCETLISGVSDLLFGSNPRPLSGAVQEKAPGGTGLSPGRDMWGADDDPLTPTCWASWGNSMLLMLLASRAFSTSIVQ